MVHGLEALSLSKSDHNTIDFVYSSILFKTFSVKESTVIRQCQFFSDCFPTSSRLDNKVFNFLMESNYTVARCSCFYLPGLGMMNYPELKLTIHCSHRIIAGLLNLNYGIASNWKLLVLSYNHV